MRLPKFRYTVLVAIILGIFIPLVAVAGFELRVFPTPAGSWLLCVWPSSIMLMATESMGRSAEALGILGYSIGINVVLYIIVLSFLWCLAWVIRAWRLSLRDGTTI